LGWEWLEKPNGVSDLALNKDGAVSGGGARVALFFPQGNLQGPADEIVGIAFVLNQPEGVGSQKVFQIYLDEISANNDWPNGVDLFSEVVDVDDEP
jgi:hypothetical protein